MKPIWDAEKAAKKEAANRESMLSLAAAAGVKVKFVFFEKATKFDEISILLLTNKFVFFVSRHSFEHQSGSQSWNLVH